MQIAAEHSERQSVGAGQDVEERFFLSRIAREGRYVICRDTKMSAFVEAHLADTAFAELDQAAMTAGITFQCAAFEMLGQLGRTFSGHRVEYGGERC